MPLWIGQLVQGGFLRYPDFVTTFMEIDLAQQRQQAHDLLDLLPAAQLKAVQSLLTVMVCPEDTLHNSLSLAPLEAEALTSETVASLNASRLSISRGKGISHDEILREFDLAK